MKKREGDPFMPPPEYGHTLKGFTINILVTDMARAVLFQTAVLKTEIVYSDPDITIVNGFGMNFMIHSDHTYDKHPLMAMTQAASRRGAGVEFRLHGGDPDEIAASALANGFEVFDGPRDQPDHGLREAHIADQDGYLWVPDKKLPL